MLLVWLPLNGNLNNQGLGNVASDDSSTPVYKDYGKLGPQSIDLATRVYFNCSKLANIQQWTVAFWGRVEEKDDGTDWRDLFGFTDVRVSDGATGTFRFETGYSAASRGGIHFHDNATYAITNRAYTFNNASARGEWHHIAVTVSNTEIKSYYDGDLVDTGTVNGGSWNTSGRFYIGETNQLNGCMQDLRIWDEAISAAEVKNISHGIVLHLPLDREGLGQSNLILNSRLQTSTNDWTVGGAGVRNCNLTVKDGFSCMHVAGELSTTTYLSPKYTIEADNAGFVPYNDLTITMSADILLENVEKGTTNYFLAFYSSGQTIDGKWCRGTVVGHSNHFTSATSENFDPNKLNGVGWVRAYVTYHFGDHEWTSHLRPNIYCRDFTGDFYVKNVKVEYGDKATAWCPNEADDLYTAYHCDDVIHDTSGYCYPAIGTNITYDSDTPRYQVCAVLDGTSYIKIDTNKWMVQGAQALTWSIWGYSDDWSTETDGGRLISCTESGGFNLEGGASGYLRVPFYVFKDSEGSSKGYVYYNSSIQLASLAPGWHLFTTTYSTSEINTYVDGVLTHSYSYTSYGIGFNKNARLYLGCEANTANPGGSKFVGKLSDFRLFYSTLSAQDVYNLYAVGASLSDTGVLFSNEVSEV